MNVIGKALIYFWESLPGFSAWFPQEVVSYTYPDYFTSFDKLFALNEFRILLVINI